MEIFTPEILNSALFPTFFFYRFLGTGLIQIPVRRQKWFLSTVYSLTICISYLTIFMIFRNLLHALSYHLSSSIANFAFYIFTSVNCLAISFTFVSVTFRYKDHHHCVIELMDIERAMQEIGAARSYQFSLKQKTWQLLGSLFICIIMIIWDYSYYVHVNRRSAEFPNTLVLYIFDYPVLLSIFGDIAFDIFNRVITHSLRDINLLLESMKVNHPDGYETRIGNLIRVEAIQEDKNKLKKLRKIYFRCVRVAKRWTDLNGLHVVSSTVCAIWLGTFQIYNLWLRFFNSEVKSQNPIIYAHTLKTIVCHIVKLYLIVSSSTTLTVEAGRTCDILLTYLHQIAFLRVEVCLDEYFGNVINLNVSEDELREVIILKNRIIRLFMLLSISFRFYRTQVRSVIFIVKCPQANKFALQLIQNPLHLSAVGLFNLDRTLIQMVIANVATYLVVLIQTDNLLLDTNPPSTNQSVNRDES